MRRFICAAAILALAACGPADGDSEPSPWAEDPHRVMVAAAASPGELAGVPEVSEAVRRTLRDEPEICGELAPRVNDRTATERRSYTAGAPDESDFIEIHQVTTSYSEPRFAQAYVVQAHERLVDCDVDEVEEQVTRNFAVIEVPEGTTGRAVSAEMTIESLDRTFVFLTGCINGDVLVQCTSVWAVSEEVAQAAFNTALEQSALILAAN